MNSFTKALLALPVITVMMMMVILDDDVILVYNQISVPSVDHDVMLLASLYRRISQSHDQDKQYHNSFTVHLAQIR